MNEERFKCILSVLNQYDLTLREKQFVEAVKKYFNEKGILTDQQESILEGVYREKRRIGKTVFQRHNPYQIPSRNNRNL